jgi:hypothetical protein
MIKQLAFATVVAMTVPHHGTQAAEFNHERFDTRTFVHVQGEIYSGDDIRFADYTRNLRDTDTVIVVLNSPGGELTAGLNIGLRIKAMNWHTSVRSGAKCASMCGMIWLAGMHRWVGPSAHIGFHGVYYTDNGQATPGGNAVCGAYLRDLGLSFVAIRFLMEAPADGMTWLTSEKAKQYGIEAQVMKN